jgi:hypothetical protein
MLASIKKGNTTTEESFEHAVTTFEEDRTLVELSGVERDGRKIILTIELPSQADVVYIMNDAGKTIGKRQFPSQETPPGKTAEMRHAV